MEISYILRKEPFGFLLYNLFTHSIYIYENEADISNSLDPLKFLSLERNNHEKLSLDFFANNEGIFIDNNCTNGTISAPSTVFFEVTKRCNLQCNHCFNESGSLDPYEMNYEDVVHSINQMSKAGVFLIKISGGEPFKRKDIVQILEYIDSQHIDFIIFTNGTLINLEQVKTIKKLNRLVKIRVSIDGNKKTNDEIRGKGTYEQALKTLKLLCDNNIPCELNFTITPKNYFQITDVSEEMKKQKIDCKINLGIVKIAGRAKNENSEYHFTKDNIQQCIDSIKAQIKSLSTIKPFYELEPIYYKLFGKTFGCPAGRLSATLKSNGDIFACGLFSRYPDLLCGNLLQNNFIDIWNGDNISKLRSLPERKECTECNYYKVICTGACRGNALNHFNDICGKDINCKFYQVDFNTNV